VAAICVEDLNISGMVTNDRLAWSVSDAGMRDVLRRLADTNTWRK